MGRTRHSSPCRSRQSSRTARREAQAASIRLDPSLYDEAGREQEARRLEDPWEAVLEELIANRPTADQHYLPVEDLWGGLGLFDVDQRNPQHAARVAEVMQRLGFKKVRPRIEGKPERIWLKEGEALPGELFRSETGKENYGWARYCFSKQVPTSTSSASFRWSAASSSSPMRIIVRASRLSASACCSVSRS